MKKLLFLALFTFACNSCAASSPSPAPSPTQPAPQPPVVVVDAAPGPQPDVDPGVRDACANLATLHCAEGMSGCPAALQKALNERLVAIPLDCLVAATSKAAVHACGAFVACPCP
ncbi:MAG TPA: hypothetical protein VK745_05065 [Polyangiaceae bacterium]|nr:hypothetical protein [Polyangiaceae bacterium]